MVKRFIVVLISIISLAGVTASANTYNNISDWVSQGANAAAGTGGTAAESGSNHTSNNRYVAMGDSVAAGLGLSALANATAEDNQCGRSSQGYPYLVAQQTGMDLTHLACSGATVGDLFTKQRVEGPNISAQFDRAFAAGTPQLITITAGANDVRWADFIRACYATNCATNTSSTLASGYMAVLKSKLSYAFSEIQNRSGGNPPTTVVTGYYNPVSNYCKNRQSYVTNAEINFLNTQRDALNRTIREAASSYPFVKYVSADFTNHGLCSSEPWSQGLSDPAPLHPTARGQQQIAASVLEVIR